MQAAGFVLVGGKSSRMGRDKALLPLDSSVLVEDIAKKVASVTGNVTLVGQPERYAALGFACLPDLHVDCGPIAGIEAALESGLCDWNMIVACDMPELTAGHLLYLLNRAQRSGGQCVVSRDSGGVLHPLCALYRTSCLSAVRAAIQDQRLRLHSLVRELDAAILDIGTPMWNLNTPEEWAAWQHSRR